MVCAPSANFAPAIKGKTTPLLAGAFRIGGFQHKTRKKEI